MCYCMYLCKLNLFTFHFLLHSFPFFGHLTCLEVLNVFLPRNVFWQLKARVTPRKKVACNYGSMHIQILFHPFLLLFLPFRQKIGLLWFACCFFPLSYHICIFCCFFIMFFYLKKYKGKQQQ